jgi:LAO/AO transport system kinase
MKAGILEVADVLVVNKDDLDGADQLVLDLEDSIRMRDIRRSGGGDWDVPVVACSALHERGVDAVLAAIDAHRVHLEAGDLEAVRRSKRVAQVRRVVGERLAEVLWGEGRNTERVDSLLGKSITPYDVAEEILASVLQGTESHGLDGAKPHRS